MPAREIDYSKTIIYKIVCNDLAITDLYVGSTTHFTRRKNEHKCRCNGGTKKSEYTIYQTIRNNGGWLNWSMVQIEVFPCANGNESRARERYWYEQLNANLNMLCPIRSKTEWVDLNKDKIKEYQTKYREENKDKLKEHDKVYYIENKQKILEQVQNRYQKNSDKIKEYAKQYHILHSDKKKQLYTCECGTICTNVSKTRHFKTEKHQAFIAQKDNIET